MATLELKLEADGRLAFGQGFTFKANPYADRTVEASAWARGWYAAYRDARAALLCAPTRFMDPDYVASFAA